MKKRDKINLAICNTVKSNLSENNNLSFKKNYILFFISFSKKMIRKTTDLLVSFRIYQKFNLNKRVI